VAWLFLVDLSALQIVLLHTAKGLQQQVQRQQQDIETLRLRDATPPERDHQGIHEGIRQAEEMVGVLSSHALQQRTSYAVHPLWLVFMDPRVQEQHEATFYPTRHPYMNSTMNLACLLLPLICTLSLVANDPLRDTDVASALEQGSTDTVLLLGVILWMLCLFVLWRSALSRRFRKTIDVLILCSANLAVCLELSQNCYVTDSGEGNCRDLEHRFEMSSSRLGLEHLAWFNHLILFIPVIFANLGFPWSAIVLGHVAATAFIWQYMFHEYTPEEIGHGTSFAMNLKMVSFMVVPHVISLFVAYTRLRSTLQLAATAMQERSNSDTFRELYEAAQLEMEAPRAASISEEPGPAHSTSVRLPWVSRRDDDGASFNPLMF
jgi:hypothetical protein